MRRLLWLLLAAAGGVLAASCGGRATGVPAAGVGGLADRDSQPAAGADPRAVAVRPAALAAGHRLPGPPGAVLRRRLGRQLRRREQSEARPRGGRPRVARRPLPASAKTASAQPARGSCAGPARPGAGAPGAAARRITSRREREFAAARAAAPQARLAIAHLQAQAQLDAGDAAAATATLKALPDHDSPRLLELEAAPGAPAPRLADPARSAPAPATRRRHRRRRRPRARKSTSPARAWPTAQIPDLLWPQLIAAPAPRRQQCGSPTRRRCGGPAATMPRRNCSAELLRDDWRPAAVDAFGRYAGDDPQRQLARRRTLAGGASRRSGPAAGAGPAGPARPAVGQGAGLFRQQPAAVADCAKSTSSWRSCWRKSASPRRRPGHYRAGLRLALPPAADRPWPGPRRSSP